MESTVLATYAVYNPWNVIKVFPHLLFNFIFVRGIEKYFFVEGQIALLYRSSQQFFNQVKSFFVLFYVSGGVVVVLYWLLSHIYCSQYDRIYEINILNAVGMVQNSKLHCMSIRALEAIEVLHDFNINTSMEPWYHFIKKPFLSTHFFNVTLNLKAVFFVNDSSDVSSLILSVHYFVSLQIHKSVWFVWIDSISLVELLESLLERVAVEHNLVSVFLNPRDWDSLVVASADAAVLLQTHFLHRPERTLLFQFNFKYFEEELWL